jgi:CheY-like chemotaxis protein
MGLKLYLFVKNKIEIDLIIMDIQMTLIIECITAEEIRKFNEDIIIILNSANVFYDKKSKVQHSGHNALLLKSF